MDGHNAFGVIESIIGALLMVTAMLDLFLTVLYARIGTGIISHPLHCLVWRAFRSLSRPLGAKRGEVLSFAGPVMVVLMIFIWLACLTCGSALIIHPKLGTSVVANQGSTPSDYITAIYIAGDSITTVGSSDISPKTSFFRMLYMMNSFLGMTMITITITFLLEIYNAMQERNTFALKLHVATAETGDAAEMVAGLGTQGSFENGYAQIAEFAAEMTKFEELHHFYPVVFYFRFREPHYAVSRALLVTLDGVSLIKSVLDDDKFRWLKQSAAVGQLWRSSMRLLTLLVKIFLPSEVMTENGEADQQTQQRWRARYAVAVKRLREAGIETIADEDAGAEIYISLRRRWNHYVLALAEHMAHPAGVIDPAGADPTYGEERQSFDVNLHATT